MIAVIFLRTDAAKNSLNIRSTKLFDLVPLKVRKNHFWLRTSCLLYDFAIGHVGIDDWCDFWPIQYQALERQQHCWQLLVFTEAFDPKHRGTLLSVDLTTVVLVNCVTHSSLRRLFHFLPDHRRTGHLSRLDLFLHE